MNCTNTWERGFVSIMLPIILFLMPGKSMAQFQVRYDGFSALGGASSAPGTNNVWSVAGQPYPIES